MKHDSGINLLHKNREEILRLASMYGAFNVRVFGSVARWEDDDESDIDLLVDMESGRSILDLGGFFMDLQELLKRRVDIVTERGVRASNKLRILSEAVPL